MVSEAACVLAQGAPRSSVVAPRVAPVSPPETGRGFLPLRSRSDFDRVFAQGTRRRRGGLTGVSVRRASGTPQGARIGLVVSRRVGGAVDRNRAKRRLRAALREMRLAPDHDQVVVATSAVVTVEFDTLRSWLADALVTGREENAQRNNA